jgi:hypothetical protein
MGLTGRQSEHDGAALSVGDHASFGAIAATRAAKRFTMISLGPRSPLLAALPPFAAARRSCRLRGLKPQQETGAA